MSAKEGPFFNLKAVVQQTGLKPDTLRAWERRYGLPSPQRSAGRHRLYSQRDVDIIKWLMARQREGLSISRAVELWQQIEAQGRDPLETPTPTTTLSHQPVGETLVQLREDWLDCCLAYDEQRAELALAQAFALYPPETVSLELLQAALSEIGNRWYRGEVTVQQEHFCSALAIRRMEALVMAAPPPTRPGRILAACAPQEEHIFGLLLLTFLLRRRGWDVVYLGANVPAERLETTIAATRPQLAILAAQQLHSAATLLETAQLLEQESVPLAYGGMVFNLLPSLRNRITGHFLGERLDAVPQVVESLMTAPRPAPAADAVPEICRQARDHYQARLALVEVQMGQSLQAMGLTPSYLSLANAEFGSNIKAALTLGDMDYLGADIDWIKGLLKNHRIPVEALQSYLTTYQQALRDNLDERGAPIIAWVDRVLRENGFD